MMNVIQTLCKYKGKTEKEMWRIMSHHPYISFFLLLVGIPTFILAGVAAMTTAVAFPVAWILGYL